MSNNYIDLPIKSGYVSSLNTLAGALTLIAGSGITITPSGNTLTIAGSGGGASVTIGTANGLSLAGQVLSLGLASASTTGALSSTDWSIFNNKQPGLTLGNLTDVGTDGILITGGTGAVIGSGTTIAQHIADATHNGYLSSSDWATFNGKLNASLGNYITNPNFETDTTGWNLYNDSGNTAIAFVVANDITYTAVAAGNAGNGINIAYVFHPTQPSNTPLVTVVSSTYITIAWYNGPTLANNPTATQLKAAYDAVPGAVALATSSITGVASNRQYVTGSHITANGGDTAPINGTGGIPSGVAFTRGTSAPLVGVASGDLGKIAASEQGQGVSTDFVINTIDKNQKLQISFAYSGSTNMVLGGTSDVQVFVYDIGNSVLIPVVPTQDIGGPVNTPKTYVGTFASSSSSNYRLILHIATTNALPWDLSIDSVTVNDIIQPAIAQKVPSLVLPSQPISGAVTDHMAVMWVDGASQWVPATSHYGNDYWSMLGFATNIIGSTADIFIRGYMDGFSFGPFVGYNQYVDPSSPGNLTPLPAPYTDTYLIMGKSISSTAMNIQVFKGIDLIVSAIATPVKGGLLSNSGANTGAGDQVLLVGTNGSVPVANSAATLGINWAAAVVAAAPFTYTTATRTLTIATATNAVPGVLSAADHTTFAGYAASIALKANSASPVFTGSITDSSGSILISGLGSGLQIKTGANAKIGTVVLVAGTKVVANTAVTANSRIFFSVSAAAGGRGDLSYTKIAGTSFTVSSTDATETSTLDWMIVESIP